MEFHAGKIYCIDSESNIAIYDLKLGTTSPPVLLQCSGMSPNHACRLSESWAARKSARDYVCAVHVVACAGELLLVLLFNGHHPSLMEVYRPAWTPQWPFHVGERVTDLRGYTLFLGRGDAVALSAKEYPAIRGNCIYYLVHCVNTCTRRSLGQSCLIWGPMLWRISLTLRCKLRRMRVPTGGHTLGFVLKGLS